MFGVFAALAAFGVLGACRSGHDEPPQPTGAVTLALTGTLNGVNYRLRSARFTITLAGADLVLDSDANPAATFLTTTLPTGNYSIGLETGWALERSDTSQVVDATLISPAVTSFQILSASTTDVIYRFSTSGGIVTVGTGTLVIGIDISVGDGGVGSDAGGLAGAGGATGGGGVSAGAGGLDGGGPAGGGGTSGSLGTAIDLRVATLYDNPPDLANWPVTTAITEVDFTPDGVHVEFSKQDGPERWPDVIPPGSVGPLQYTLGLAEQIDGHWYASAAIEFWFGLYAAGGNVALDNQIASNWYYDANRWGLMARRQPATGEMIGVFVVAGNARDVTSDDPAQSPVMERSNVVLVPMPGTSGAMHSF